MKKIFVISLFTLAFSLISDLCQAQFNKYHPFPDSNAGWNEFSWHDEFYVCSDSNGPLGGEQVNNYSYHVNGDTTLNGKKYIKLYYSGGVSQLVPCGAIDSECYDNFYCLLRNDTSARRVYVSFDYGVYDTLLYDFNLQMGDTLPDSYINLRRWGTYVSSIDSVLVGITYRKRFLLSDNYGATDYIIEGIGSTLGMMEVVVDAPDHGWYLDYFIDSTAVYPFDSGRIPAFIYKCPVTSIVEIRNNYKFLSVFPNPSTGIFTIQSSLGSGKLSIEVYNVLGEKVLTESLLSIQGDNTINIIGQPNGIYLYRVLAENGELIGEGKVLIQK